MQIESPPVCDGQNRAGCKLRAHLASGEIVIITPLCTFPIDLAAHHPLDSGVGLDVHRRRALVHHLPRGDTVILTENASKIRVQIPKG